MTNVATANTTPIFPLERIIGRPNKSGITRLSASKIGHATSKNQETDCFVDPETTSFVKDGASYGFFIESDVIDIGQPYHIFGFLRVDLDHRKVQTSDVRDALRIIGKHR